MSLASGSKTVEATRLPSAAHSATAGFHESLSAPMPTTMLPPLRATWLAGSRPLEGAEVPGLDWLDDELPQAAASRIRARLAAASTSTGCLGRVAPVPRIVVVSVAMVPPPANRPDHWMPGPIYLDNSRMSRIM